MLMKSGRAIYQIIMQPPAHKRVYYGRHGTPPRKPVHPASDRGNVSKTEFKVKSLILALALFAVPVACAQQPPVSSPLLDHLAGKWLMEGTMAGQPTKHDLDAQWVLDHHYLRIHEVSREKKANGQPRYEAFVFIAWNEQPKRYSCAWLDVYGGFSDGSIGVAPPSDHELAFVFKNEKGEPDFSNHFAYDPKTDTWSDTLDNIVKGAPKPFGRIKLSRR